MTVLCGSLNAPCQKRQHKKTKHLINVGGRLTGFKS